MANELKGTVINMKSLSQDISDPIIVGGGNSDGRYLTIIFTQEAAAQFSDLTQVYLSWRHVQKNIKGYNVFTKFEYVDTDLITADEQPPTWYIYYPKNLLHEGDVIACIELVDDISVSTSVNFTIHVLADPWAGSQWIENDDLSEFKIAMNKASQIEKLVEEDHQEMTDAINYLYNMFNVNPFEDENQDGIPDETQEDDNLIHQITNEGGLTIVEWTGGE